ncbi:MAG: hypothetical protein AAFX50_01600 [Acidobacteriota bacterium]
MTLAVTSTDTMPDASAPKIEAAASTQTTRILVIGDGAVPTGFGRLVHSVLERLPERYEVHHLGINHRGEPHGAAWPIYPASLYGDVYGIVPLSVES